MRTHNILQLSPLAICHLFMKNVVIVGLTLLFFACSDTVINTEKSVSGSNNEFKLELRISDDIVRYTDSIKLTATVERLVHKDSIVGTNTAKLIMDAVGGTIDGHSFTTTATFISVTLDIEKGSVFEALAFFLPTTSGSGKKENGHISASFDGINLSMPITIVEPR
jgi:hypothetical protein